MKRKHILGNLESVFNAETLEKKNTYLLLFIYQILIGFAEHFGIIEDEEEQE